MPPPQVFTLTRFTSLNTTVVLDKESSIHYGSFRAKMPAGEYQVRSNVKERGVVLDIRVVGEQLISDGGVNWQLDFVNRGFNDVKSYQFEPLDSETEESIVRVLTPIDKTKEIVRTVTNNGAAVAKSNETTYEEFEHFDNAIIQIEFKFNFFLAPYGLAASDIHSDEGYYDMAVNLYNNNKIAVEDEEDCYGVVGRRTGYLFAEQQNEYDWAQICIEDEREFPDLAVYNNEKMFNKIFTTVTSPVCGCSKCPCASSEKKINK